MSLLIYDEGWKSIPKEWTKGQPMPTIMGEVFQVKASGEEAEWLKQVLRTASSFEKVG